QGAVRIGTPANDANLATPNTVLVVSTGSMTRAIIVDNGSQNAAGLTFALGNVPTVRATQGTTLGNITLNTPLELDAGTTTNLPGNISGPAMLYVSKGTANFSGNVGNAGG